MIDALRSRLEERAKAAQKSGTLRGGAKLLGQRSWRIAHQHGVEATEERVQVVAGITGIEHTTVGDAEMFLEVADGVAGRVPRNQLLVMAVMTPSCRNPPSVCAIMSPMPK